MLYKWDAWGREKSQILGIYLKFCEFEGRAHVGRVHSRDTHQRLYLDIPPAQTTAFTKVRDVGLITGMLTVKFVLLIPHWFWGPRRSCRHRLEWKNPNKVKAISQRNGTNEVSCWSLLFFCLPKCHFITIYYHAFPTCLCESWVGTVSAP